MYGQSAAELRVVRWLSQTPLWLEVRIALREQGFSAAEIARMTNIHPRGCPCWDCIRKLRVAVQRAMLRRVEREREEREREEREREK